MYTVGNAEIAGLDVAGLVNGGQICLSVYPAFSVLSLCCRINFVMQHLWVTLYVTIILMITYSDRELYFGVFFPCNVVISVADSYSKNLLCVSRSVI